MKTYPPTAEFRVNGDVANRRRKDDDSDDNKQAFHKSEQNAAGMLARGFCLVHETIPTGGLELMLSL